MAKIIDGKKIAEDIKVAIHKEIFQNSYQPNLAVILIGDDPASQLYVSLKKEAAKKVGIEFHEYLLAEKTSQEEILKVIDFLNKDKDVDAILVQLPLPKHLDTDLIIQALDPNKDVDGFHPQNIKNLLENKSDFIPGLPLGIVKLLDSTEEDLKNKKAIIVAKSEIFYQPLQKLLNQKEIKTKIVKPADPDLKNKTKEADILITAIGQAFAIHPEMVKKDAIVIDVGTNQVGAYTVGDVDYSAVFEKVSYITPVPGGVGPMTVAMLLYNTLQLYKKNRA
ncbi:bifunctional 5,10-methylenetetrahydrofolate dehydrogenase/5,10-methenyltetrahydrofolate cyclohydrolase [Candidatus Nomurabacteria bacterium]|nr:bifunctional 5,10-methylenetetrahydrofolate dehydrogenase/5,10-methenyltetrahydrofolate cyclohydrolase [Candidatus Nomurabacteria bacterium]